LLKDSSKPGAMSSIQGYIEGVAPNRSPALSGSSSTP
jgi:hypothetical protein